MYRVIVSRTVLFSCLLFIVSTPALDLGVGSMDPSFYASVYGITVYTDPPVYVVDNPMFPTTVTPSIVTMSTAAFVVMNVVVTTTMSTWREPFTRKVVPVATYTTPVRRSFVLPKNDWHHF